MLTSASSRAAHTSFNMAFNTCKSKRIAHRVNQNRTCGHMTCFTSSLMMVALLSDLSAEVIFLPRSARTMVAV